MSDNPKLTQKQISLQLCFSCSTFRRYRDQTNMPSPFNRKTTERKKLSSQIGSITVKGGICEIENVTSSGEELIDKAFDTR